MTSNLREIRLMLWSKCDYNVISLQEANVKVTQGIKIKKIIVILPFSLLACFLSFYNLKLSIETRRVLVDN